MMRRSNHAEKSAPSRMCGTMSCEGASLTVPSPLAGEGQGEGWRQSTTREAEVPASEYKTTPVPMAPPSLSLPRKGGGNDVALFRLTPPLHSRDALHVSVRNRP